jgi:hypothetical protein
MAVLPTPGSPRQHLHDPPDLLVATDHGVDLFLPGQVGQVAAVAVQDLVLVLRGLVGDPLIAPDALERLQEGVLVHPVAAQELPRLALDVHHRQKQMLSGDVFVLEIACLHLGVVQHLVQLRGKAHLGAVPVDLGFRLQELFHLAMELKGLDAHRGQKGRDHPVALLQQRQEQVLRVQLRVIQAMGVGLRRLHGFLGLDRELVQTHGISPPRRGSERG